MFFNMDIKGNKGNQSKENNSDIAQQPKASPLRILESSH
jgi:hypothetical protein